MARTFAVAFLALSALAFIHATTVEQVALAGGCETSAVRGLSLQLIDEMNCLESGLFKSIDGNSKISIGSSAFPYLQTKAADALFKVVSSGSSTLSVNSALRTLPQQYLLYRWKNLGLCGITAAAAPGRSNHNGGLAVDVSSYSSWITPMSKQGWQWFGDGDKVHFDYTGSGTQDVRSLSTLAFQKLWNANNPSDQISEDGDYGPNTEKRLQQSPADGFATGSTCTKKTYNTHNTAPVQAKRRSGEVCTIVGPKNGTCVDVVDCLGRPYGGYCPGPNNIQCCVSGAQGGPKQTTDTNGVNLIKSFEGFYPNFYYDEVGIKTIGYGHACHVSDCSDLEAKDSSGNWREVYAPLSETDASDLLRGDLDKGGYEDCVAGALTRSVSDDAFSSLVSFVYNVGCSGFQGSTLRKRVNANAPLEGSGGVREAFLMWNKAGGQVYSGLTRRRNAEADLYGSITNQAVPPSSNSQYEGKDCWYNSQKGVCLDSSSCTGTTHSGLCSGPSNIKCCLSNKCTVSTTNDGVCIQSTSCTGTTYSGLCMGANDIKCCLSSRKRQQATITVLCPDNTWFNQTLKFCQDDTYVYGPFPDGMVSQCKSNGGGSQCTRLFTVTVNGTRINVPRWKQAVAWAARGQSECPFGTILDENTLGECVEYLLESGSNDTYSSISVFGAAIDTALADVCYAQGGGVACYSTKWSAKFYTALANPGVDQNLDNENTTTSGSADDFTEIGNWWLEAQMKLSNDLTESAASTLSAALAFFALVAVLLA